MFRSRPPPIPHPAQPSSDGNYLSVQVQQLLAMVLPESVVTVLASLSDLLYRAAVGKPNDPPTYTSTLVPPVLLLVVTYLSFMLVYRSIKSFFTFIIFSVKWFVIVAALFVLVAYSLGNGNVEQGARVAAQRSGLNVQGNSWSEALQRYPAAQQVAPYLYQAGKNLGGMAAAMPLMQDATQRVLGMMQGNNAEGASTGEMRSKDRITREYRDVRPAKKRFSFGGEDAGSSSPRRASRSVSNPGIDQGRRRVSAPVKMGSPENSGDSTLERFAKRIGAVLE